MANQHRYTRLTGKAELTIMTLTDRDAIPPLSAFRVIDAVVRHRNYSWAAQELSVTHSAISQTVKRLETQLGFKLFERQGGEMVPLAAAVDLANAYADAERSLRASINGILSGR
jgi:LysR family transcriptional regulator, glycine cleavage system transcriptional activator